MVQYDPALGAEVVDAAVPLAKRFRTLFTLRAVGGSDAVSAIGAIFAACDSALFKHEAAYCLGQMGDTSAVPTLIRVLEDVHEDVMVRHEAGEALGAIGHADALEVLQRHVDSDIVEIAETCQIALDRVRWASSSSSKKAAAATGGRAGVVGAADSANPYDSVDPAPPVAGAEARSTEELRAALLDTSASLFERYRALFALRNDGSDAAVLAIVDGLGDRSALFRHEIAYVLGQMQHVLSVDGLAARLQDKDENYMVRHEAAEALGSIADPKCLPLLEAYAKDADRVVRESCEVALDMAEYERSGAFQYADGLVAK